MSSTKNTSLGVSSRTQLDLRGLLAQKQEEVARNKAAGQNSIKGGVKRPDKKPPKWMAPNPGVKSRAARDIELEDIPKATLDQAMAKANEKSKRLYNTLKGKDGGLSEAQLENMLFDPSQKAISYDSDSDDVDESLTVPVRPQDEDDPVMEYEDEYGRTRTARRSEIPSDLLPKPEEEREDFDSSRWVNPVNHYPTYQPTEERWEQLAAQAAEDNKPLNTHFDSTREVRAVGAAYYKFSGNEEAREQEQARLKELRQETSKTRELLKAPDIPAGAVEGMQGAPESTKSRAAEKRKRLLEERNKQLEARRKKRKAGEDTALAQETSIAGPSNVPPPTPTPLHSDPFAVVEAHKSTQAVKQEADAADDFLAKLEQDVLLKQRAQ
ncbi:hypothetical protein K466DRAFT_601503 [Polyporus arcularius HHB13444]|uniref:Uncharacterized protein n=1 Tax=Polyporus arcularius HHB13444 TaxID=1314778 RepID=A0A5C3P7Y6_9APHY|nr:hypothetical protein K466DRAFT_601503 [Polyporus arcularius HHB13444]